MPTAELVQEAHAKKALVQYLTPKGTLVSFRDPNALVSETLRKALDKQGISYDNPTIKQFFAAVDALSPFVRSNDVFLLVSGNHRGSPDIALVGQWAERLHKRFPQVAVWTLTSGLASLPLRMPTSGGLGWPILVRVSGLRSRCL